MGAMLVCLQGRASHLACTWTSLQDDRASEYTNVNVNTVQHVTTGGAGAACSPYIRWSPRPCDPWELEGLPSVTQLGWGGMNWCLEGGPPRPAPRTRGKLREAAEESVAVRGEQSVA